ncbi:fibronectin type III domain-containing protein [Flexithrix dorotheae]|uniref:fibronectin type III domain-containing protein n=1 Tax=Flexithrix dorotheae TaxID=70993 RepID=UPI00037FE1B2|nr:fibronectin type III domain-containing protein [Flexithrix dorotheae]
MKACSYSAPFLKYLNRRFFISAIVFIAFCTPQVNGQTNNPWTLIASPSTSVKTQVQSPSFNKEFADAATFKLQPFQLQFLLSGRSDYQKELSFPMPDGKFEPFILEESIMMESGLREKFPEIQTFKGKGKSNPGIEIRMVVSPNGLHATIQQDQETVFINPAEDSGEENIYKSYKKSGFSLLNHHEGWEEGLYGELARHHPSQLLSASEFSTGKELKVYRLAVAATGEYSDFHGGTTSSVLAAIVTAVNRVNGIFEKELGIRLILVADNDKLIFLDPATDPYSNGKGSFMVSQNQTTIDNLIGFDNYDVGHVFGKGKIGDAYIGSVCTNQKAAGASGTENPIGDAFYVDFFAHELGHQFGAHHTQNSSCLRNEDTAYEPASGSTIMGYAGICPPNLQMNSDPYFHSISFEEIHQFITEGAGKDCGEVISIPNSVPEIQSLDFYKDLVIPAFTPFQLNGTATDVENDPLTYCWEQFDLGPSGEWDQPSGSAPIFRSFSPKKSGYRSFPKIESIIENEVAIGEILPTYTRDLNFRLSVRDGKGGISYKAIKLKATDNAGPFVVTSPNEAISIEAGTDFSISWDPAGTNNGPVNCQKVNILLSVDGGFTFEDTLALNTVNDGLESVNIPFKITKNARIKIEAADHIFFDISDEDFAITPPTFSFTVIPDTNYICIPGTAVFNLDLNPVLNFKDSVKVKVDSLPEGLTSNFTDVKITPPANLQLIVSDTGSALLSGEYIFKLLASSAFETQEKKISLNLSSNNPGIVSLVHPVNPRIEVSTQPAFSWKPLDGKNDYQLEITRDSGFTSIEYLFNQIDTTSFTFPGFLESNSKYYWRVRGENICGPGKYSSVHQFQTVKTTCEELVSSNVPVVIPENISGVVYSNLDVQNYSQIQAIRISSIKGTHAYVGDLEFIIIHPDGQQVKLLSGSCDNNKDFSIGFDDNSSVREIICPLDKGEIYIPIEKLSALNGKLSGGIWKLAILDKENADGGQLDSWSMEICTIPLNFNFSSKVLSQSQIDLNWDDIFDIESGYILERSKGNNENFEEIAFLESDVNSYVDENLDTLAVYYYRIKAVIGENGFSYSGELNNTTFPKLPDSPDSLQASNITQNTLLLSWKDNSDNEDSFVIEIASFPGGEFYAIDTVEKNQTSTEIKNLEPNSAYLFKVNAVNLGGESSSGVLSVKTLEKVPNSPKDLEVAPVVFGKMMLSWKDQSENESGFIIDRSVGDSLKFEPIATLQAGVEFFIDSGNIEPEQSYYYIVRAINPAGISPASNVAYAVSLPTIPTAPEGLSSNFQNDFSANILWKDLSDNEDGFIVERSKLNTNNFIIIDTLPANSTFYLDENLFPELNYFYRIKAFNRGGNSEPSPVLEIQTLPEKFKRPTNLRVSNLSPTSVLLEWQDNGEDELGFIIERATDNENQFDSLYFTKENVTSYSDLGLMEGDFFIYRVIAVYNEGKSRWSNEVSIKVGAPIPSTPFGLKADSLFDNRVYLSWESTETKVGEFILERSKDQNLNFEKIKSLPNTVLTYLDSSLAPNTTYHYRVKCTNEFGESGYSNVLSFKTLITSISEENLFLHIDIFPNPVSEMIYIKFPNGINESKRINILDNLGRNIKSTELHPQDLSFQFDFSPLPKGIYILQIFSENIKLVKKIIKN